MVSNIWLTCSSSGTNKELHIVYSRVQREKMYCIFCGNPKLSMNGNAITSTHDNSVQQGNLPITKQQEDQFTPYPFKYGLLIFSQ